MNIQATIIPTDNDIQSLRDQLAENKRIAEYQALQKELCKVQELQKEQIQVVDGNLHCPDTDKVLKTRRVWISPFEVIFNRIKEMASPRPVIGSISALLIGMVCLTVMYNKANALGLSGYQHYIGFGILIAGAYQIIKSGSRSLFLPLLATLIGVTLSHALTKGMTFLTFDADFYRYLMFTGIIGLGNSMFHIE